MSFDKLQPVIKLVDMTDDMMKEVIEVARLAIDKSSTVNILINIIRINRLLAI